MCVCGGGGGVTPVLIIAHKHALIFDVLSCSLNPYASNLPSPVHVSTINSIISLKCTVT